MYVSNITVLKINFQWVQGIKRAPLDSPYHTPYTTHKDSEAATLEVPEIRFMTNAAHCRAGVLSANKA